MSGNTYPHLAYFDGKCSYKHTIHGSYRRVISGWKLSRLRAVVYKFKLSFYLSQNVWQHTAWRYYELVVKPSVWKKIYHHFLNSQIRMPPKTSHKSLSNVVTTKLRCHSDHQAKPRKSKDQTLPHGSREPFTWIIPFRQFLIWCWTCGVTWILMICSPNEFPTWVRTIVAFWVKSSATSVFTQVGYWPSYDTMFSLLLKHNSYIMLHPNWVDIPSEPSMQTIALFWDPCHPHGWQWAILPGSIISPVTSKKSHGKNGGYLNWDDAHPLL